MKHIRDEDLVITFKGIMEKLKIIVKNGDLDYIYSICRPTDKLREKLSSL